jgi:hypothetical protein
MAAGEAPPLRTFIAIFPQKLSNNRSKYGNRRKYSEKNINFQKYVVDFPGAIRYTVSAAKWRDWALKWSGGEAIDR